MLAGLNPPAGWKAQQHDMGPEAGLARAAETKPPWNACPCRACTAASKAYGKSESLRCVVRLHPAPHLVPAKEGLDDEVATSLDGHILARGRHRRLDQTLPPAAASEVFVMAKDDHWIEKATAEHKGKLREEVGAKPGHDISKKEMASASKSKNKTERKEAALAEELDHFRHAK